MSSKTAWWRNALLAAGLMACSWTAQAAEILFISGSPVSPGKFNNLAKVAKPYGIDVRFQMAERLGAEIDGRPGPCPCRPPSGPPWRTPARPTGPRW